MCFCTIERQNEGKYTIGDIITCELGSDTDKFYVVENADSTTESITALTEYAIDLETYRQSSDAGTIAFAPNPYWCDSTGSVKTEYIDTFIYDQNSNVYSIVKEYENYLNSNGLSGITAELISNQKENLNAKGYTWYGYNLEYWIDGNGRCNALGNGEIYGESNFIFMIDSEFGGSSAISSYETPRAVRPVITISTFHIK